MGLPWLHPVLGRSGGTGFCTGVAVPMNGDHVRVISFRKSQKALSELAAGAPLVQVASTTAGECDLTPLPGQFALSEAG